MYFNYDSLAYRNYSLDCSFTQLRWDMLLKFAFETDLKLVQKTRDCVDASYIELKFFNGSNLAFAYANRFFQSIFVELLPRFNLVNAHLRGPLSSLKSIGYILRNKFKNLFIYLLLFHLQFKQGVIKFPVKIFLDKKMCLLYLGILNSFYIKPVYDFGDREWLLRWSIRFCFIHELEKFEIMYFLSFLKIFYKK